MSSTTLNKVIEDFNQLPLDDKDYVIDIIKKQLIEAKREAIAKRAETALSNLKKKKVKSGTIEELYKYLNENEILLIDIGSHDEVY